MIKRLIKKIGTNALLILIVAYSFILFSVTALAQDSEYSVITLPKVPDFTIDGYGSALQWNSSDWITIPQRETATWDLRNKALAPTNRLSPKEMSTRAKMLYSDTGIYFLFQCEDRILQATMEGDYMELWWEDVVEIFLWPDENVPVYFEYQLSPLNIVSMTQHKKGSFSKHFVYHGENHRTLHKTSVSGGEKKSLGSINQWTAEIFIPFNMLRLDQKNYPEAETKWQINLYRFDYDTGDRARWEWQPVSGKNHDIEKFGTLLFE